jgi:gliding motility-associated protein GldE
MIEVEPNSLVPLEGAIQAGFGTSWDIISILILLILLAMSALVSGSEAAFFSLSPLDKEELNKDDGKRAKYTAKLLDKPRELLATILITNNFVNVGIVILSSSIMQRVFQWSTLSSSIKFLIEVVLITLIILLVGEVIPKVYATKNARKYSNNMSITLYRLNATPPISWIKMLLVSGIGVIQKRARKGKVSITSDELEQAIALTKEDDVNEEEHRILEGIVKFGNTQVRQIMKSRMDVYAIEKSMSYQEVMELILDSGHSRIPVYEDSFDNIEGVLFIKDLLPHLGDETFSDWHSLIRPPFFVTEKRKIDDLLKDFQEKKVHLALVVDEYGGTSGIVTLEDVLEEIVGDITDEFDDDELIYTKINENTYLFEGKTALVDVFKVLDCEDKDILNDNRAAETVGGLVVEIAGRIPKNNESVEAGPLKMIVESSDKKRVKMIKVIKQTLESEENE